MRNPITYLVYVIITVKLNTAKQDTGISKDALFLQKSVTLFGPPRLPNYRNVSLPGLELALDDERLSGEDVFLAGVTGNYTIKMRAVAEHLSYNDHYKVAEVEQIGEQKIVTIKGQYTEKIPTEEGGYYLRTIGYIKDEKGYHRFLIDISKVTITKISARPKLGGCGRLKRRSPISLCTLVSLVGR